MSSVISRHSIIDDEGRYSVIVYDGYLETLNLSGKRIGSMYRMMCEIITSHTDLRPGEFLIKRPAGLHCYDRNCRCRPLGQDMRGTAILDQKLKEIKHYQRYPQLIPFIGRNYMGRNKKLLLLAESHYLLKDAGQPDGEAAIKDRISDWYNGNAEDLGWNDYLSTNTALLTNNSGVDLISKAFRVYDNLKNEIRLISSGNFKSTDILTEVCFANFFQRPAFEEGGSIKNTKQDNEVANSTLREIIAILRPDYLFFISDKAYRAFDRTIFPAERVGHSPHPGCAWWNTKANKYDGLHGRDLFSRFIKDNQIF